MNAMKYKLGKMKGWIGINFVGMLLYLYLASKTWNAKTVAGGDRIMSGPGVAMLCDFGVVILVNMVWLTVVLIKIRRPGGLVSLLIWALSGIVWWGVIDYDFYRTGLEMAKFQKASGLGEYGGDRWP